MDRSAARLRDCLSLIFAATMVAGCTSGFVRIAPAPSPQSEKMGQASGSACGSLLFDSNLFSLPLIEVYLPPIVVPPPVPAAFNSRVRRAYENAIRSVPGATALVGVSMREDWYWWALGTTRCVTISGEAVR